MQGIYLTPVQLFARLGRAEMFGWGFWGGGGGGGGGGAGAGPPPPPPPKSTPKHLANRAAVSSQNNLHTGLTKYCG
jgi:hypothetical protein